MTERPRLFVIAGPNGSGKTTWAMHHLPHVLHIYDFLNTDEIARGISPLAPMRGQRAAGEVFLRQMDAYIRGKRSFAFETTAAGLTHLKRLQQARALGYDLTLHYLFTRDVQTNIDRVAKRVAAGGHDVARADIIRRYHKSAANILRLYLPVFDHATFTMMDDDKPTLFARKECGDLTILEPDLWALLNDRAQETQSIP